MKIAVIGIRGIPNYHGGFEQFAEYFSVFMALKGHEVYVYNSHNHPYQEETYKSVNIIHCYDPEYLLGTAGQFLYDFNCILDSRKRRFDIILQLGYTSSSIWNWMFRKPTLIVTNMDGLEWKRTKYSSPVQKFLKFAEKLAIKKSDFLISDSIGIKNYLKEKYRCDSQYIAYGADVFENEDEKVLLDYNLQEYDYNMLIARLEPENNIEPILDGVVLSSLEKPFLVIGKHETKFGEYLKNKYRKEKRIRFLGAIYNMNDLNNLRYYSSFYFHGHSVGGTNPSLLEAMASKAFIVANDNVFNKSILEDDALYFRDKNDVKDILNVTNRKEYSKMLVNNFDRIKEYFNWDKINQEYLDYLEKCLKL